MIHQLYRASCPACFWGLSSVSRSEALEAADSHELVCTSSPGVLIAPEIPESLDELWRESLEDWGWDDAGASDLHQTTQAC